MQNGRQSKNGKTKRVGKLSVYQILFYGGILLIALAVAGILAAVILLRIYKQRLIEELNKEYGRERLKLVHKNFPEVDMSIVTPCEMFMEEFLRLFREKYEDAENYFKCIGLDDEEIHRIQSSLTAPI